MSRLNGFLTGVKILDLSQYIPGPMATLFLADMGAEVLKIEPPQGDEMRGLGPRNAEGAGVFYGALNAGKSIKRMNLKDSAAREEFLEISGDFDVLVEGFRPGVTDRLGIGSAKLRALHPRLIYCSLSGYGALAQAPKMAAHDGNFLAASGLLDRNGEPPRFFDPPLSDTCGALFAALAIVGALHEQRRTGHGCHIDLALADVMMPLQVMQIAAFGDNGHPPKTDTTYLNGGAAYYQIYRTREGRHVMLGSLEAKFWRAFCETAKRPDWIDRQSEPLPQTALIRDVALFFSTATLEETLARFAATDCCLSPVLDLHEAIASEHTQSRRLIRASEPSGELQALFPAYVDGEAPEGRAAPREETR